MARNTVHDSMGFMNLSESVATAWQVSSQAICQFTSAMWYRDKVCIALH